MASQRATIKSVALDALPIGMKEIAELCNVSHLTVEKWIQRGLLPDPEPGWRVSGRPAWRTLTIVMWAVRTKRLTKQDLRTTAAMIDWTCLACTNYAPHHNPGCQSAPAVRDSR